MNTHYNIPAGLVAQRDATKTMAEAARTAWQAAQDAEVEDNLLAEMWEDYEDLRRVQHEALWALQQAWLDAWRAQAVPADPEVGRDAAQYEEAARHYRLRADLDRVIMDAYIELGHRQAAWNPFWQECQRMDAAAELCQGFVDAQREQAEAEAERERLLAEWAVVPVAERKSSHPNFRARVAALERAAAARERWFLSPLHPHDLPVEARRLWLALEPCLHIARQMAVEGSVAAVVAADIRRQCAEAGAVGEAVIRYAGLA